MINKVYEKIKELIKENIGFLVFFFVILFLTTFEFPYYIDAPGGTIDVNSRITIENSYNGEGSFNLAYVSELKATIPTLIMAKLKKDWDIIPKSEVVASNENTSDVAFRDQLMLKNANQNAIIVGYTKAGMKVDITEQKLYVTYRLEESKTNLEIGDQIISINKTPVLNTAEVSHLLEQVNVGDTVSFEVKKEDKIITKTATVINYNDSKILGIMLTKDQSITTDPSVEFHFKSSESGPSGGLIMSLSIYDLLTKEDLTCGKKIVGTGTIDEDGTVGSIDGVKYKLKGAMKSKADLFLVPAGRNYEEAINYAQKQGYDIPIIAISTFDEAVSELQQQCS